MAGFGGAPAGSFPAGMGSVPEPQDAPTGHGGSRFLNAVTRDYEIDATTGQFKQMPPTRQRVTLAVATELDSSGLVGFGIKPPRKMGDSFESEMRAAVARALRHMTDVDKTLRLNGVKVERGNLGRARVTIAFTDLVTGERDQATVNG